MVSPRSIYRARGFTLIELLVVIAIIGILSAVVLASLNTARTKGNDAGVKANLDTVKTQAALYQNDNNGYGSFPLADCPTPGTVSASVFGDGTVENAIASAKTDGGSSVAPKCATTGDAYAVEAARPQPGDSTYWCVDSTGTSCATNGVLAGTSCPSCL